MLTSPSALDQSVTISAGSDQGIALEDVVVTDQGLVGTVTKVFASESRVMLITDPSSAVRAVDQTNLAAVGILDHGTGSNSLILDRVGKDKQVDAGDTIITAGSPAGGKLPSLFPRNIPIGTVTSVGQNDTDIFKQIQVQPFVDLSSLQSVLVLIPKQREPAQQVILDSLKAAVLLFVAVLVQVSMLSAYSPLGGTRRPRARRRCSRSRCCAARSSAPSPASAPAC